MEYSMVNHLVIVFCVALPYDSLACKHPTSVPNRLSATADRRNWRMSGVSSTS